MHTHIEMNYFILKYKSRPDYKKVIYEAIGYSLVACNHINKTNMDS